MKTTNKLQVPARDAREHQGATDTPELGNGEQYAAVLAELEGTVVVRGGEEVIQCSLPIALLSKACFGTGEYQDVRGIRLVLTFSYYDMAWSLTAPFVALRLLEAQ